MTMRAFGLLAVALLAAGCALEQGHGDEAAASDPASSTVTHAPAVEDDPAPPVATSGGHQYLPSTAPDPCDPDPQPWRPNCPKGAAGNRVSRDPVFHQTPSN